MEFMILVIIVFVVVIVVTLVSKHQSLKNLKWRVQKSFGAIPEHDDVKFDSIRRYYESLDSDDTHIDAITWNDLDMNKIFLRINACQSSVGEEYLYSTLHRPQSDATLLNEREAMIRFFDAHETERFNTQLLLARVGKVDSNGVATLMSTAHMKELPHHPLIYKICAALPLVAIAVMFLNLNAGLAGLGISFIINVILNMRAKTKIEMEIPAMLYFSSMMGSFKRLCKIENIAELPILKQAQPAYQLFKSVTSKSPTYQQSTGADLASLVWMYLNIMILYDVRHYNNFMKHVNNHRDAFETIYTTLGEIDMAIAVLSFRKSLPEYCLPVFHTQRGFAFENIAHPLIVNPVTNTHQMNHNSLITGSNASGKSTFIKTLAINGILAQTINTCTAKYFALRFSHIMTSMALRDDLMGGESYFIVEIKSLKSILDVVAKYPCTCFIDEILRGTNTTERIAASASILTALMDKDCLCIAASHDIELTSMTGYDNYHFRETVTDGGVIFDYTIKDGPSTTRNAIKLLEFMGFDKNIVNNANRLANEDEQMRIK